MCATPCPQPAEADAVSAAYPSVNPSKLSQRSQDMRKAFGMMQRVLRLAEIVAISLSPRSSVTTCVNTCAKLGARRTLSETRATVSAKAPKMIFVVMALAPDLG